MIMGKRISGHGQTLFLSPEEEGVCIDTIINPPPSKKKRLQICMTTATTTISPLSEDDLPWSPPTVPNPKRERSLYEYDHSPFPFSEEGYVWP